MKLKFLLLSILILTLVSCTNTPKKSKTIIGELIPNTPITQDFSKFSGTESYKFTISKETILNYDLKIRNGKTIMTIVDEDDTEYLSIDTKSKDTIVLKPNKETTYFVNFTYDNGVGTYTLSIEN